MKFRISCAPSCWGVDDPKNPYLPPWRRVLAEAAAAGYRSIELGPYGYMPLEPEVLAAELEKTGLSILAGTIFADLVDPANRAELLRQTDEICALVTRLPRVPPVDGQRFPTPYLTVMDYFHAERAVKAGHPATAPRLSAPHWAGMVENIRAISRLAWDKYGVRPVIHPHAGGYIEFHDEIERIVGDIPADLAGLCLDTGHLYYSGMDPSTWLTKYAARTDYVHFKDVNQALHAKVLESEVDFFEACSQGVMCPLGTGALDYPGIRLTLEKIGYRGWLTVEQERDPRDAGSSQDDVTKSYQYLKKAGF